MESEIRYGDGGAVSPPERKDVKEVKRLYQTITLEKIQGARRWEVEKFNGYLTDKSGDVPF